MIVIKGNLIINGDKLRIEYSSETSSELIKKEIVAFADLTEYDTTNATIIYGNVVVEEIEINDIILVTGEVAELGGAE